MLIKTDNSVNITNEEMHELEWFCRRYDSMMTKLHDCYGLHSGSYDTVGAARGGGTHSDPTAAVALRAIKLQENLDLIDKALEAVAEPAVLPYLKKAVTKGLKYEYLDAPMGRRQFYALRRRFFVKLWELRNP